MGVTSARHAWRADGHPDGKRLGTFSAMEEQAAAGLAVCRGISTPCAKLLAAGFSFSCVDDAVDPQPQMTRQQRAAVCEDMPRSGMSSLFTRRAVGVCSPKSHRPRSGVSAPRSGVSSLLTRPRESGADGSLGRKGAWGGWEPGAEGSMGRIGVWGGREYGAEGSLGRMGALGGPTDRRGFQPALAPNLIILRLAKSGQAPH